jgi:hypothetical protein
MALTPEPLLEELVQKLHGARKRRDFKPKEWIDQKTDMFNDYLRCV